MRATLSTFLLWGMIFATMLVPSAAQSPYSDSQLDTLVGPIALYPDAVLSNVVRASTYPAQVIAASKTSSVDKSWDASVSALHDFPGVLTLMAGNQDWMKSLGWAASNQLPDLMDAVQRYRYRAQQAGNLDSNSKVVVIQEGTTIRIESANPQVIYVPTYDANLADDHDLGTAIVWGAAIATSAYLWSNVYHWNNNCFYAHPYGYRPPAAYYRPYGWQNTGIYGGAPVRINGGNTVVRGPVTVNNVNVNRNTVNRNTVNNVNRTNVSTVNRTNVNNTNRANVNNVNRTNVGNLNSVNRSNVSNRVVGERPTSIARPAAAPQMPANRSFNRGASSPGLGSYSSSGSTVRESNRGAASRQRTSVSSGARMGGGGGRRR